MCVCVHVCMHVSILVLKVSFSGSYVQGSCFFLNIQGNWNYFAAIRSEKRAPKLEATHLEKAKELYTKVLFCAIYFYVLWQFHAHSNLL